MFNIDQKAWVISVNMGYGHQRTAYALKDLAFEKKIINANDYEKIPKKDREIWETTKRGYEFFSSFKKVPLIGDALFFFMDQFQKIFSFYPKRDLSSPTFQLKQTYNLIEKGWGKDLIEKLKINNEKLKITLPIVSTFFTPAFMAERFGYPGEIFCTVCDADISRAWAPICPQKSKIKYFAPTERVAERLRLYGVKSENIFLTGYPLSKTNIGSEEKEILKEDLKNRLLNLDPKRKYFNNYKILIDEKLGQLPEKSDHVLTITFCVGGAGAQKETGITIVKNLLKEIQLGKVKIILVAGIKKWVEEYFKKNVERLELVGNKNVEIIFAETIGEYFEQFNNVLRKTDILWTKPSELSFYSALGIPIIIAPTIGSQEEFNERWLLKSGFGIKQENPKYINQWLFDWVDRGYLAEAAMQGFVEGENLGTYNIQKIICSGL